MIMMMMMMMMVMITIIIMIMIMSMVMVMIGVICGTTKFMMMENEEFGRIERFDRNWGCANRKSEVRGFDPCGFCVGVK
jgi:hypothetical protein